MKEKTVRWDAICMYQQKSESAVAQAVQIIWKKNFDSNTKKRIGGSTTTSPLATIDMASKQWP
jgi:hypothetical protein